MRPDLKRVGIDASFFMCERIHPHGALFAKLLQHNFSNLHQFQYYLFFLRGPRPDYPWLSAPNITLVPVDNRFSNERLNYWLEFEHLVCKTRLDLFMSPFYRFPLRARLGGVPMIHMIHDVAQLTIDPRLLPVRFRSRWKRIQLWLGFKFYCMLASSTITVSRHARLEIIKTLREGLLGCLLYRIAFLP